MDKVQSIRGKQKILYNGYVYVKQKVLAGGVISYECEKRRGNLVGVSECKAKVKVQNEVVVASLHEHTHGPDSARCEVLQVRQNITKRAVETEETPQQILGREMQNLSEGASVQMVPIKHLRRQVRRKRQVIHAPQPLPNDRATIELPDVYKKLPNGENFLLFDSGVGDINRILIFGTAKTSSLLAQSPNWFMDGTFAIVPELFFQLYTVHALIAGDVISCLYCLLPNKSRETYQRLFIEIKALTVNAKPATVMMDYEKAAMNAVAECYAGIDVQGCFYHLSQSIYRKVQALGFQERYQDDAEFAMSVRMVAALAFVPLADTVQVFEELQEFTEDDEMIQLLDYFEDNYIGRRRRRGRGNPLFVREVWSVHSRVQNELPRTNNSVEGWHRKMQAAVAAHHPNIWRFLTVLQREQSFLNVKISQQLGGHPVEPPRKKYRDCNARIMNIVNDFVNREHLDYLRAIAHNIQV